MHGQGMIRKSMPSDLIRAREPVSPRDNAKRLPGDRDPI